MLRSVFGLLAYLVLFASPAIGQDIRYQPDPDTPIGVRNPAAPPQTAEFDFLIGDWDAAITLRTTNGQTLNYIAHWHNVWIVDGFVVMQEWRGPYSSGSEIRQFNAQLGHWEGVNIYAGSGTPQSTTARFENGEMVVTAHKVDDERGPVIGRETYFNITEDSFEMRADQSYDDGETWERGVYEMTVTRRDM